MVSSPTLFLQPGTANPGLPTSSPPTASAWPPSGPAAAGLGGFLLPRRSLPLRAQHYRPLSSTLSDPFSIRLSCNRVLSDLHLCPLKPSTRAHTRSMTSVEGVTQRWNTSVV